MPTNCRFEITDAEEEWEYTQKFDYLHLRMTLHCFKDHLGLMKSAFNSMRSGGYI